MANNQNLKPWKEGQSGNPAGKPKGTKHISTWIQELLSDEQYTATIQVGLQLQNYEGAPVKAIVAAQITKALNGDQKAFELLAKYGFNNQAETVTSSHTIFAEHVEMDRQRYDIK